MDVNKDGRVDENEAIAWDPTDHSMVSGPTAFAFLLDSNHDGMITAEACADAPVESIGKNEFLCLPHKEVHKDMKRKADDTGRGIKGMQRLQARYDQVMKSAIWGENSKL